MSGLPTTTASGGDRGGGRPRIGKYVIMGRIGRGGMGMVYRGYDEALDREVAVKTLTLDGSLDKESRARFEVEAKAAAKLQHPNIVTVFELNQDGKLQYIAMELLPGGDLESLLRSGETLLLPEKLDIIIQMCRGLHYAHERGVVHRDVKPSNIRLLDDGSVKILDFGIAKLANTNLTRSGMMVGTVHYMCPEQIQGQAVDGRSDVFSVGVIFYELLSGRRPFEGAEGGINEILYKIVNNPTPALPDLGRHTTALQNILNRALAKKPAERHASAARLAEDLVDLRSRLETPASSTPDVMETIEAAQELVKEGRVDEGVTRLRQMVERTPQSVEARRALRAACREAARRSSPSAPAEAEFPELTYQVGATQLQATAYMDAGQSPPPVGGQTGPAGAEGRTMLLAGAIVLGFALVAGVLIAILSPGRDDGARKTSQGSVVEGTATTVIEKDKPQETPANVEDTDKDKGKDKDRRETTPAVPPKKLVRLTLATDPPGAQISLDGKTLAGQTPLEIEVDNNQNHTVSFSLDGYLSRRVTIPSDAAKDVSVPLIQAGPPGTVNVASAYPVDVMLGDGVLAKAQQSPSVSLPAGRHTLRILAPSVFLRMSPTVEVRAGEAVSVAAPALGFLNVQANPDNCEVFVDGEVLGYLPIRKKPVASGRHTVVFKWPDGVRDEKVVEVAPGAPAFVTGER